MSNRTNAQVIVYRAGTPNSTPVATIPITREATRKWKLMEEDCITLDFFNDEPIHFAVGDYLDDELFGRFYIVDEPKPAEYNPSNGAYRHQLQFDKEYIGWKNKGFQMTLTVEGTTTRAYPSWSLTDVLKTFMEEFSRNLRCLGYTDYHTDDNPRYSFCIDGETLVANDNGDFVNPLGDGVKLPTEERFTGATEGDNTAYISFDGADLVSSLKAITDAYHCEWWVKEVTIAGVNDGNPFPIVCLGKCEYGDFENFKLKPGAGDYVDFWDKDSKDFWDKEEKDFVTADTIPGGGINMESIALNRSEQKFANRLYVFGGTTNIPSYYGKELAFEITNRQLGGSGYEYWDANHPLSNDLFRTAPFSPCIRDLKSAIPTQPTGTTIFRFAYPNETILSSEQGRFQYEGTNIEFAIWFENRGNEAHDLGYEVSCEIYWGSTKLATISPTYEPGVEYKYDGGQYKRFLTIKGTAELPSSMTTWMYDVTGHTYTMQPRIDIILTPSFSDTNYVLYPSASRLYGTYKMNPYAYSISTGIIIEGTTYGAIINVGGTTNFHFIVSNYGDVLPIGTKFGFVLYPDSANGLDQVKVPLDWYYDPYGDPNAVRLIGEKRLRLPSSAGQFIGDANLPREAVVEQMVVFNDIFPKCALRVTSVESETTSQEIKYEDGSSKKYDVLRYKIQAQRITESGDVDFPFDKSFLSDYDELKVKFITADEEKNYTDGEAYGSGYKLAGMTFSVVWNETEDVYYINWNEDYGAQLPNDTLKPIVGDPILLLGWNVAAFPELGLIADAEAKLVTAGQQYLAELNNAQFTFDCSMMSDWAYGKGVLQFGQKARVWHEGLALGYRESRVIAYELHLDYPYNTPKYTVGETEAYSRLKALERELNEETRGASAGAVINATGYGSGGGGGAMDWYNIKPSKHPTSGKLSAIIENYSENLEDDTKYRMVLLRWRKSRRKPYYFNSWHAPMFGSNNAEFNEIPAQDRYWAIESNEQVLFGTTGHEYTDVLPLLIKQREEDGTYQFKNTHNRKMYFGCAIYKNTGVGRWGWQRVSNIAVFELFITNSADILLSIKPQ